MEKKRSKRVKLVKKTDLETRQGQHKKAAKLADVSDDVVTLRLVEKVLDDGTERYSEDKKLIGDNLRTINPEFSETDIVVRRGIGMFEKIKKKHPLNKKR